MESIEAVALRLENQNVGAGGTTIFYGSDVNFPTGPTAFISILQTAGRPSIGAHNASALRQPGFQITSRGDLYTEALALLAQAYTALGGDQGLSDILIGDVFFLSMRPSSEFIDLPPDANQRVRIAFNVSSLRR